MTRLSSSISSSKRITIYVFACLAVGYGLLLLLDFCWTRFVVYEREWQGTSIVKRAFQNEDPNEIPIFGSSMAQRSYIPEILGDNFYNYGRSGSNYQKIYPLVEKEFAKKRSSPIIIDFYNNFLNYREDYTIQMTDFLPLANEPLVEELLKDFDMYSPAFKISGIRYFGFFTDYWADRGKIKKEESQNYFNRGGAFYVPETPKELFDGFVKERLAVHNPFTVNPILEARFLKTLESRPDRRVVLVITPSHRSAYGTEIQLEDMVSYLEKLEARFPNVTTIAFDGRTYPDSCFKDTLHPNIRGAKKFSSELKVKLRELGIIGNSE
jgi:hypothetical protein